MGKLIVFEGPDGSGKSTQFRLLTERLEREHIDFRTIVFPRYSEPSSALIRMYLGGEFGEKPEDVNACAASTFYAVDRYASFRWLYDLEFVRLGLPLPDLVIYLDMPTELSEGLMRRRESDTNTHADIHEKDRAYLRLCRKTGLEAAACYGWTVISCAKDGKLRTVEEIHEEIYRLVRQNLNPER